MKAQKRTIGEIRREAAEGACRAVAHAQVESAATRDSSGGKPFQELKLRDADDAFTLRAWSDSPLFDFCKLVRAGECVAVEGEFQVHSQFGLEARRWTIRRLDEKETEAFFAGDPSLNEALLEDFAFLERTCAEIADPRLRALAARFLEVHGERFRRAAAARQVHHARRGGLCAHTAQMLRGALGICAAYPRLNRDLLAAGVLFHDCGKLWETCPPERGFEIPTDLRGEMLGHISIGIELVNRLWADLEEERKGWETLEPPSEMVRLHLLHLVASHHGELQFGSPMPPKTPEAFALHHLDNLDARLEMLAAGYEKSPQIAPGVHDRIRALGSTILRPLEIFTQPTDPPPAP